MKKQMVRDAHGYINERGASKYWGVTTSKVDGERIWVVNFKVGGLTLGYRPKNFTLKEIDAARIAAFLYESGEKTLNSSDPFVKILSADKKYVFSFDINDTYIYREKAVNQKVYQFQPNLTLPLGDEVLPVAVSLGSVDAFNKANPAQILQTSKATEIIEELSSNQGTIIDVPVTERQMINMLTDAVFDKTISPTAARIMIGILEQV